MFPLVCALCLFCTIKSSVASLSDYYEGHDSLISQSYKHGDNGNSAGITSLLGKQPEIKAVGSGIRYGVSGISHSGITVPGHDEIYSYTPVHSGDLSLTSLDLSKHISDQLKSLQGILQGSKSLTGYRGHANNFGALDSLSLGQASSDGLHDIKNNDDIYRVKTTHSEDLLLPFLNLAKHTSGVNSLYGSKFLSGYIANSNNHGSLSGYIANSNNQGFLSGYSANFNNHGLLSGNSANSNNHGSFSGYSANSNNHGLLSGYSANTNNHGSLTGYSANSNNHGLLSGYSANSNNHGSLSGYSANSNNHGLLSGCSANSNNHGSLSGYSANSNNHGLLSGYSANSNNHGSLSGYNANSNNHGSLSGYSANSNNHGSLDSLSLGYASFGGLHDAKPLHHENENYIKHLLHSSDSGTLHNAGDSQSFLPDHVSSSEHLNTGHDEEHSDFRRLADTLVRGWTALLNH